MKKTYFITMLTAALMGSAYANTDYTATPGTDCSPPVYVYGTYADTGEASGGAVGIFEGSHLKVTSAYTMYTAAMWTKTALRPATP